VTDEARSFGRFLAKQVFAAPKRTSRRGRPPNTEARDAVLLQIVADMLEASSRGERLWVFRSLNANGFRSDGISYRHFRSCAEALVSGGYAEHRPGFHYRSPLEFGQSGRNPNLAASRWRPAKLLIDMCGKFDIEPANAKTHFSWKLPEQVVVLKAPSVRSGSHKVKGRQVRFQQTDRSTLFSDQVKEINKYLLDHEIANGVHRGFRRIFNDVSDISSYGWNRGGRIYGIGMDNYQLQPKDVRRLITIDGKPTTEIDIKASHLTILHALAGVQLPAPDPYAVPGLPREVVKSWFLIAFGAGHYPTRWSKEAYLELKRNASGAEWLKKYRARAVTEICKAHYAKVIAYWETSGLDSLDFQFLESEAVIDAMLTLKRKHDVPSLPVHDSIIIAEEARDLAIEVLSQSYKLKFGAAPLLA